MVSYSIEQWQISKPGFDHDFSIFTTANLLDPQFSSRGATDIIAFDESRLTLHVFASVREGKLDSGALAIKGARHIKATGPTRHWTHIEPGSFGKSGAEFFLYDRPAGLAMLGKVEESGALTGIATDPGLRKTWSLIVSGKFSEADGRQLFFYDATDGSARFASIDAVGKLHVFPVLHGLRRTWHTIVAGNFTNSKFDDLLLYDRGAGRGEFHRTNGNGGLSLVSVHDNWRETWRSITPGQFDLGAAFDGLLFHEEGTGFTEIYGTNGHGEIHQLAATFDPTWQARTAYWRAIRAGNFIGMNFGMPDLCCYDSASGDIAYFQVLAHQ